MPTSFSRFKFIHVPDDNASERSKHLLASEVRAHSARVAASRRDQRIVRARNGRQIENSGRAEQDDDNDDVPTNLPAEVSVTLLRDVDRLSPYTRQFIDVLIPLQAPRYQIYRLKMAWDPFWLHCMANQSYHNVFAARLEASRGPNPRIVYKSRSNRTVLQYKLSAIREIRKALAKGGEIDVVIVLAILQLGVLERELGDVAQADLHRNAILRLIQERPLDPDVMERRVRPVLTVHNMLTAVNRNPTICPGPQPYGPFVSGSQLNSQMSMLAERLPRGFKALARKGLLSVNMIETLDRVSEFTRNGCISQAPVHTMWAEACPSLFGQPDQVDTTLEIDHLVSLGLRLYIDIQFTDRSIQASTLVFFSGIACFRQNLTEKLLKCVERRSKDEEECLIWLLEVARRSWISPEGVIPPIGQDLTRFRYERFGNMPCSSHKFFEFGDMWP